LGADLYIEQIHTPLVNRYKPLFLAAVLKRNQSPRGSKAAAAAEAEIQKYGELMASRGYFRDNYNGTSVLWRLGLSWWGDVIPLCDEHRKLEGESLIKFQKMVHRAKLKQPTRQELKNQGLMVADHGKYSVAGWHAYFRKSHAELLAFLDEAIALKTSIHCSL
jgi:hypothetical protein